MNTLLNLLALAGGAAAAWNLVRAAFRFLRDGAFGVWLDEMERTHARQGDLTSLEERRRERAAQVRGSRLAALEALGWLALLVAPTFTTWPRTIYAFYALFWLHPLARRAVGGRGGGGGGSPGADRGER